MDLTAILVRIEQRLRDLHISAGRASLDSGLSRDAIRNLQRAVRHGKGGAHGRTLTRLPTGLRTNLVWLIEGRGDPDSTMPNDADELATIFAMLSKSDQEILMAMARRLREAATAGGGVVDIGDGPDPNRYTKFPPESG